MAVCLLVLPILAIFKRTRKLAGSGFLISSWVFGGGLWILSALVVYLYWGGIAVFIGIFIAGIGVFPMALIIVAWEHLWELIWPFAGWIIPLAITRIVAAWLLALD